MYPVVELSIITYKTFGSEGDTSTNVLSKLPKAPKSNCVNVIPSSE